MEPQEHKKGRRFHYPRSPIIFEIASVLCVIAVALYFILGASAHTGAPQKATSNSAVATTAPASPTPTSTPRSSAIPPWNGPAVQILSVVPDNSTVKINFKPVAGAKDYRVFDVAEPTVVKYAGMAHLEGGPFLMNADGTPVVPFQVSSNGAGPDVLDIPFPQIEWNLLEDEQPHTLIVQAVNMLGPVPPGNLYGNENNPLTPSNQSFNTLGTDEGATPDGHVSINGQGPSTDNPQVIAQSQPFVVQANPNYLAIPSVSSDTQTFFDTFDDSEASAIKQTSIDDADGRASYTLNAGTDKAWTINYQGADVRDSYPFINAGHFMDVLFDGGTPGSGIPLHVQYGLMTMTPDPTVDFSNGKVLHITMEVDLHQDSRRWVGIELAPANDPLTHYDNFTGAVNNSDKAFFFDYSPGGCDASVFTGQSAGPGSNPNGIPLWGSAGQANTVCDISSFNWGGRGIPLDNRGRLDLFFTQNHVALFIDGRLAIESDIPGGMPFTQARVYFTHYVYHTGNDINELKQYDPWETFWINYFHWSDERHWDNMGFEVFPASAASNSAAWQRLVAPPQAVAPRLVSSATGSSGTGNTGDTGFPGPTVMLDTPKGWLA